MASRSNSHAASGSTPASLDRPAGKVSPSPPDCYDSRMSESTSPSPSERPRLYLIDGYSVIFRAFYAIRNLSNSSGEPTNAVFGFLQILRKLLRDEKPSHLGIAMDMSSNTVRKEKFEGYKANRKPMPDDLKPQIPWIRKVIEAYDIPIVEMERYEADDVLGTLATKGVAEGFEVILVSPDKDLMQLVGDGVLMYHTGRDKLYDAQGVAEDFGVPPEQVVDVLALMGDASDNVPGVPGIGEKGAKKLIAEHGSLTALLDAAEGIKRKTYREGLQTHREQALLSQELVTIHRDLDIELKADRFAMGKPDWSTMLELCRDLDFHQLAKEIEKTQGAETPPPKPAVEIDDLAGWQALVDSVRHEVVLSMLGEPVPGAKPLGLALAHPGDEPGADWPAFYVDFRRPDLRPAVLDQLRSWAADESMTWIGHDLKEVLRLLGPRPELHCRLLDLMLVSYLNRSSLRGHDFASVVADRLHVTAMAESEVGLSKGEQPMVGDERVAALAAERAVLASRIYRDLDWQEGLEEVYRRLEEPLIPVLSTMEENGIQVDSEFLSGMSDELQGELEEVEEDIYRIAGERFNIQSPKQLGEIMFVKLDYPVLRKTRKTKSWSTDADTLEELAARGYDLPERILHFREMAKLKSTYVDVLPLLADQDGRVHTRFNQGVAATGRLSSAHPNLQNIPIRARRGEQIRKAFVAGADRMLVVADYSQVELRVLAHMAEEEGMIDAFRRGEDIHATTAATVFGGSPLLINSEQRRIAKVINFGIVYGMTSFGLGRQLGVSRSEAQTFIDTYMEKYPGVRGYTERTLDLAMGTGEVSTLYGRVRQVPDIRSRNWNLRENAKRMAVNAPIQGTAADLMKMAMIAVYRRVIADLPAARLLLTVHDELVLECPADQAETLAGWVREEMEGVAELTVPLKVDVGVGPSWYDTKG